MKDYYRFVVLVFNCLAIFGCFFCYDMPSALQSILQAPVSCNETENDECIEGFGLTSKQYNLLYAVCALSNVVAVLIAGYLVDRFGNPVGLCLFSVLCLTGSSLFTIAAMLKDTPAMYPVMLLGRVFLGTTTGTLFLISNRINSFWFRNKELALAFGMAFSSARAGGTVNFFLTKNLANEHGVVWTLWFGVFLVTISFIAAITTSFLDVYGMKQLTQDSLFKPKEAKVRLADVTRLSSLFWLVSITIALFYSIVYPFMADSSEFIRKKYHFSEESPTPAYYTGATYCVSIVVAPSMGRLIDHMGSRSCIAVCCSALTIPVFCIFCFTEISAVIGTIWLGFTYAVAIAALWPCVPLVVPEAIVGTAMGVTSAMQMIGIGISNVVVGEILGDGEIDMQSCHRMMLFFLGLTFAFFISTVLLHMLDTNKDGILSEGKKQKQARLKRKDELPLKQPPIATLTVSAVVQEKTLNDKNASIVNK